MGFHLYTHLQFCDLSIQIVQAAGEKERVRLHGMEFIPPKLDQDFRERVASTNLLKRW